MCDKLFRLCTGETLEIAREEEDDERQQQRIEMQNGGDSTMIDHGDVDVSGTAIMIQQHQLDDDDDDDEATESVAVIVSNNNNKKSKNKIRKLRDKATEAGNSAGDTAR